MIECRPPSPPGAPSPTRCGREHADRRVGRERTRPRPRRPMTTAARRRVPRRLRGRAGRSGRRRSCGSTSGGRGQADVRRAGGPAPGARAAAAGRRSRTPRARSATRESAWTRAPASPRRARCTRRPATEPIEAYNDNEYAAYWFEKELHDRACSRAAGRRCRRARAARGLATAAAGRRGAGATAIGAAGAAALLAVVVVAVGRCCSRGYRSSRCRSVTARAAAVRARVAAQGRSCGSRAAGRPPSRSRRTSTSARRSRAIPRRGPGGTTGRRGVFVFNGGVERVVVG